MVYVNVVVNNTSCEIYSTWKTETIKANIPTAFLRTGQTTEQTQEIW